MAGLLDFLQGVAGAKVKQGEAEQADRREYSMYERKSKLASRLEIEMAERKAQLAQQYPTYAKFATTATGDVIGITTQGNPKKVYEADPETKSLLKAASEAKTAENVAQAEERGDRRNLLKVQAEAAKDKMDNPGKYMRPSASAKNPNQLTASQYEYALNKYVDSLTTDNGVLGKVKVSREDAQAKFNELLKKQGVQFPGSGPSTGITLDEADSMDDEDTSEYGALQEAVGGMNLFEEQ